MSDILDRLRFRRTITTHAENEVNHAERQEAADEIERLRAIEQRAIGVGPEDFDWQRKSRDEERAHWSDMHYILTGERIE